MSTPAGFTRRWHESHKTRKNENALTALPRSPSRLPPRYGDTTTLPQNADHQILICGEPINGSVTEMRLLAALATRAPRYTLAVAIPLIVVAAVLAFNAPNNLANSETEFFSHDTQSYRTGQTLIKKVGLRAFPNIGVIFPLHSPAGTQAQRDVQKIAFLIPYTFRSSNGRFGAELGYTKLNVTPAALTHLTTALKPLPGVSIGGASLVRQQFIAQVKHDLVKAEIVLPLILLLAFLVFRTVVAALLLVLAGGATTCLTLLCLQIINTVHPLSVLTLNVTVGIGLGLSLDYSLLLVTRYREELARTGDSQRAARISTLTAGRTVIISSATVGAAFASLLVFPVEFLQSVAIAGMLASVTAGIVSVTILPATCSIIGTRIDSLAPRPLRRLTERTATATDAGFWYRLALFVTTRPVVVALLASALILTVSAPAFGVRLAGLEAISNAESGNQKQFEKRLSTEFTYPPVNNIEAVMHGNKHTITVVTKRYLEKLPYIVRGEVRQIGSQMWMVTIDMTRGMYSDASTRLVHEIRAIPYHLAVTGPTAEFADTSSSLRSRLPLALALLLSTTLTFLFIATRSVILPLKSVAMNILSLTAAFGVLVFIFQDGRFEGFLAYHGQGALLLAQIFLIGAATFGILTDYSVFMLTRIKEGWDSGLPNKQAIALGVERTGRVITAAALLFCVAVGAPVMGRLIFVKETGVGLVAAIAIDATIVRAFLVPSLMTLLGSWNWWPGTSRWRLPLLRRRLDEEV